MHKKKTKRMVKIVEVDGKNVEETIEVAIEDQKHIDAREARIALVKNNLEAAKLVRVELEKNGFTETDGVKLDREAKEAEELEEASVLKVIENFSIATTNNLDLNIISEKTNEIIDYLNGSKLTK